MQVNVDVPDEPAVVMVTDATGWQTSPADGLAVRATTPVKVPIEVTVTVDDPEFVARILDGVTGLRVTVKLDCVTMTETLVVLDSVAGAVPVVPVTSTVNPGEGCPAEQVTDRTAPENEATQSAGTAPAVSVTDPENPLIGVTTQVEVPAVPTVVLIEGQAIEKSWTVTETLVVLDSVAGAVPVVPVTGTVNGATPVAQVTDKTAPANEAVQPEGTAPATNVTEPVNPLIGVTVTVDVPATVARVVIAGPAIEKSTTWKVTEFDCFVCTGLPPVPVTVTV